MLHKQLTLALPRPGGRAGRSGRRSRDGLKRVEHITRPLHQARNPLHVTLRVRHHVWNLRNPRVFPLVREALAAGADRFGFRLTEWSVQTNHLHLVVEGNDRRALTRGLKGLGVRIAKKVNRLMGTKGAVFADRYHAHVLRSPGEVRNTLVYVLNNHLRHAHARARAPEGGAPPPRRAPAPPPGRAPFDPCSTAWFFLGWRPYGGTGPPIPIVKEARLPAALPHTWLLRVGWWQQHGFLDPLEIPGTPQGRDARLAALTPATPRPRR